jgi:hypothetical protein
MKTKIIYENFAFFDRTGMIRRLEKMAARGWFLESITAIGWRYRRGEPQRMHYAVMYFHGPITSDYNDAGEETEEFARHSGWRLAAETPRMQIFASADEDPVPLNSDPVAELTNISRTAKKFFLSIFGLELVSFPILAILLFLRYERDPLGMLADGRSMLAIFLCAAVFIQYLWELCAFLAWRSRAKKAALRGEFIGTRGLSLPQRVMTAIMAAGALYAAVPLLYYGDTRLRISAVLYIIAGIVTTLAIVAVRERKRTHPENFGATILIIAAALLIGAATLYAGYRVYSADRARGGEEYEYIGLTIYARNDTLPLSVEDLRETDYTEYDRSLDVSDSPLLRRTIAAQTPRFDAENRDEIPDIEYTIYDIKVAALYGYVMDALFADLNPLRNERYSKLTNTWGANAAYSLGHGLAYILCYENRIVEISFDWTPDEAQMGIVGEKLGK